MRESRRYFLIRRHELHLLFARVLFSCGFALALGGCLRPPLVNTTHPVLAQNTEATESQPQGTGGMAESEPQATPIAESSVTSGGMIVIPATEQEQTQVRLDDDSNDDSLENAFPPDSVLLDKVPVGKQTRPLNCEFQSASDLVWYYGYPYAWDEIFAQVGPDPNGNPHVGFVGDSLDDPPGGIYPHGYGVYAEPIAKGLQELGIYTEVYYGKSAAWLREQLAAGHPVMVWATAGMIPGRAEYWTTQDGQRVKGVRGEHTYLVIGYDDAGVWVGDPWDGQRKHYPWQAFLSSWDILNRMSLMVVDPSSTAIDSP